MAEQIMQVSCYAQSLVHHSKASDLFPCQAQFPACRAETHQAHRHCSHYENIEHSLSNLETCQMGKQTNHNRQQSKHEKDQCSSNHRKPTGGVRACVDKWLQQGISVYIAQESQNNA